MHNKDDGASANSWVGEEALSVGDAWSVSSDCAWVCMSVRWGAAGLHSWLFHLYFLQFNGHQSFWKANYAPLQLQVNKEWAWSLRIWHAANQASVCQGVIALAKHSSFYWCMLCSCMAADSVWNIMQQQWGKAGQPDLILLFACGRFMWDRGRKII